MYIDLLPLKEDFPIIKNFLLQVDEGMINLLPYKPSSDILPCSMEDILKGIDELYVIMNFSEHSGIYKWKIEKRYIKAVIDWLGLQNYNDTVNIAAYMRFRNVRELDNTLYAFYSELDEQYIAEECKSCK